MKTKVCKTKVCNRCKELKNISEFYKHCRHKDGLSYWCKKCQKEASREWGRNHREKHNEYNKKYYHNNKETVGKLHKKYYQKNKEEITKQQKEWYRSNYAKKWGHQTIYQHKQKGYKVLFTREELLLIAEQATHCPFCDTLLKWGVGKLSGNSPSLDRTDNGNILTLDNIQIICNKCNVTKSNRTMKEFIDYCEMIYNKFSWRG